MENLTELTAGRDNVLHRSPTHPDSLRLLIIDDDKLSRMHLSMLLTPESMVVSEASSGQEGLDLLSKEHFDIILLDVRMPGMDGFTVCDRIRSNSAQANLPIIILTGNDDITSIEKALRAGANDFVTKPFRTTLLVHRIRHTVAGHRDQRELDQKAASGRAMEATLRLAIEHEELGLVYQPKVSSINGCIQGVEALVRWDSPEYGPLSPADFIPLAEKTGLILPLGEYVLRSACKQVQAWKLAGFPAIPIAVNVSGHQLGQRHFDSLVMEILAETNTAVNDIELEITESIFMGRHDHLCQMLNQLRTIGVRISLDDFGTGFSSLSLLKILPLDVLKIDRSFVMDIISSDEPNGITDAIIALGKALNLKLVAEGVETQDQLLYFKTRGCELIQGYLTGRPMSANEIAGQYLCNLHQRPGE